MIDLLYAFIPWRTPKHNPKESTAGNHTVLYLTHWQIQLHSWSGKEVQRRTGLGGDPARPWICRGVPQALEAMRVFPGIKPRREITAHSRGCCKLPQCHWGVSDQIALAKQRSGGHGLEPGYLGVSRSNITYQLCKLGRLPNLSVP